MIIFRLDLSVYFLLCFYWKFIFSKINAWERAVTLLHLYQRSVVVEWKGTLPEPVC